MATRANTFSWAGSAYATNPLAGGGNYDPRRPSLLPDTQEEDALVWKDVPKAMQTRLVWRSRGPGFLPGCAPPKLTEAPDDLHPDNSSRVGLSSI